jgi:hypothetical protein
MALNEEEQGLSTLGQPMVSPLAPVVTQDAVQKLVDAYHQGFVTTNDILEHTGALAQAKGQSALDLLKITPDIVEAQKAQANLNTAKARAEIGLIPGTTDLTRAKTAAELGLLPEDVALKSKKTATESATLDYGPLLAKAAEYGNPRTYTADADGKPVWNVQADAALGAKYLQYENVAKWATTGLTPRKPEGETVYDPVLGRNVIVHKNAFGEIIDAGTPGNPNKIYDEYQNHLRDARKFLLSGDNTGWHSDKLVVPASHEGSAAAAIEGKPTVTPAPATPSPVADFVAASGLPAASAEALIRAHMPVVTPAPAAQTTVTQHPDGAVSTTVTPGAQPVINPGIPGEQPVVGPRQSLQSSIPGAVVPPLPDAILAIPEKTRTMELYKNWAEKAPTIARFRATQAAYTGKPDQVTNQLDLDLAQQALLLASASTSGRGANAKENSIKSLEDAQPFLEQAFGIKAKIMRTRRFEPETRQRIIDAANRSVQALEHNARGAVKTGRDLMSQYGADPVDYFTPDELALINGGASSGAPQGVGQTFTLPSGRKVVRSQ